MEIDKVTCSDGGVTLKFCDIVWNVKKPLLGGVGAKVFDGDGVKQKETLAISPVQAQSATPGEKFKADIAIEMDTTRVEITYR